MAKLKLKDGTVLEFANDSNMLCLIAIYKTYDKIDQVRGLLTEENLKGAVLTTDQETITFKNILPNSISAFSGYDDEVSVHFNLRQKTEVELLQEQINTIHAEQEVQNEALDYLAME